MVRTSWQQPPLTPAEADDLFMLGLDDDAEGAPWMVMGDLQFWAASAFAHALRIHARRQSLGWYVASMLPIEYDWPNVARKKVLAPDTFVAFVADRPRASFDVAAEGGFPPFVLEVVSPSSRARDEEEKRHAYDLLGAREYALFTPLAAGPSTLAGYRRGAAGSFEPWPIDAEGRLWSEALGLHLAVRGPLLRALTADGRLLPTPDESEAALRAEEEARRRAEGEVERLRRELERLRRPDAR